MALQRQPFQDNYFSTKLKGPFEALIFPRATTTAIARSSPTPAHTQAPFNSQRSRYGNPPPHLLCENGRAAGIPRHQLHQHPDGASRPCSRAQPQSLLTSRPLCSASSASVTPSRPFPEGLPHPLHREKPFWAAGQGNASVPGMGAGSLATSSLRRRPAAACAPARGGTTGEEKQARLVPPGQLFPGVPRQHSRPRHVLMEGRRRRRRRRPPGGGRGGGRGGRPGRGPPRRPAALRGGRAHGRRAPPAAREEGGGGWGERARHPRGVRRAARGRPPAALAAAAAGAAAAAAARARARSRLLSLSLLASNI